MESTTDIRSQVTKSVEKPEPENVDLKILKRTAAKAKRSSENVAAAAKQNAEIQKQDVDELIRKMNDDLIVNKRIKFRRHPVNNRQLIQVIDSETDKVIMEIPPAELVNLSAKIHIFVGMMMDRIS